MTNNNNSTINQLKKTFINCTYKKLIIAEIVGLIFCLAMSFVFHFAYEWFNRNIGIAWLFATNESVWEHSKIIFYPFLLYSIVEFFIIKSEINGIKSYLTAKSIPLIFCIPIMITIFYTYSGIIGNNFVVVDILLAVAIIITMFIFSYKILVSGFIAKHFRLYTIIAIIIALLIIIFTYYPIHINLFFDETKNIYGVF